MFVLTIDWTQANYKEIIGFAAAFLVFLTFFETNMKRLRAVAICSNLTFISYAIMRDLLPVILLHSCLLPLNSWRLYQLVFIESQDSHRRE
ncbi:hypothetical protein ACWJJH_14950 [Endozoicomonadaceae bacterium StTr2]